MYAKAVVDAQGREGQMGGKPKPPDAKSGAS